MASFDAYKTTLIRTDARGRLVILPFGPRGQVYLVPDDRTATEIVKNLYTSVYVALAIGILALALSKFFVPLLLVALAAAFVPAMYRRRAVRALTPAGVRGRELPTRDPVNVRVEYLVALGARHLWNYAAGGAVMAALGGFLLAISRNDTALRGPDIAYGAILVAMGVSIVAYSLNALRTIRSTAQ